MALFLLDTSVCVDILRDTLPAAELPAPGDCCLSAMVTAELRTGLAKHAGDPRRERKLDAFVALFPVRDFDDLAARHYADIRVDLEGRGIPIGPLDLLIAAHARSLDAVLVTGNVAEFTRVRGLDVMSLSAKRKKR
jgi:tRNA(fMet)-specific endonuclease VapC